LGKACSKQEGEMCTSFSGQTCGKENTGANGRIIQKWFLVEWGLGRGLKLSALGQGQVLCAFECDKGNSGSINC